MVPPWYYRSASGDEHRGGRALRGARPAVTSVKRGSVFGDLRAVFVTWPVVADVLTGARARKARQIAGGAGCEAPIDGLALRCDGGLGRARACRRGPASVGAGGIMLELRRAVRTERGTPRPGTRSLVQRRTAAEPARALQGLLP